MTLATSTVILSRAPAGAQSKDERTTHGRYGCRNGISSYELARGIQVTQRTAWFMLHRIREAMQDDSFDLMTGTVEVDEAYIGGLTKNMNKKRRRRFGAAGSGPSGKQAILGMVERKGRVRAWKVPHVSSGALLPALIKSIDQDATVYTDKSLVYKHVHRYFMTHSAVNHHLHEYVRGNVQ